MLKFDVTGDMRAFRKGVAEMHKRHIPFATSLAVNNIAQGIVDLVQIEMQKTFDAPSDFTMNSVAYKPGKKGDPTAVVYIKNIGAAYIGPYIDGGNRSLLKRDGDTRQAFLTPRNVPTTKSGALPRGAFQRLKSKPNTFVGTITTKDGRTIGGLWERPAAMKKATLGRRRRGTGPAPRQPLKLLIQFTQTSEVPRRLPYYEAAKRYMAVAVPREFAKAFAYALRTAK